MFLCTYFSLFRLAFLRKVRLPTPSTPATVLPRLLHACRRALSTPPCLPHLHHSSVYCVPHFSAASPSQWYYLAPRASGAYSMLLNGSLMCRFAYPICFNYLNLVHVDDRLMRPTYFSTLMSRMNRVPFFGDYFNTFYPLIGVVFFLLIAFNAWGRTLGKHMTGERPSRLTTKSNSWQCGR